MSTFGTELAVATMSVLTVEAAIPRDNCIRVLAVTTCSAPMLVQVIPPPDAVRPVAVANAYIPRYTTSPGSIRARSADGIDRVVLVPEYIRDITT